MKKLLFAALFLSVASMGWAQSTGVPMKKWELQLQGGWSLPVSPYFANGYTGDSDYKFNTGFSFGGAVGYKITPQFSVLANVQLNDFRTNNPHSDGYYYFWDTTELSLLLKYRILTGPLTPFVFAGPGIVLNASGYQYTTYYSPSDHNYSEALNAVNPMLQLGLGLEYALNEDFSVFTQAAYTVDFNDGYANDWTYGGDMPTRYMPIQLGVILNL